ncbi:ATP-dependent RNA helicase HrpA [Spongiibacter taiwanensis]|uniref:ATP-dependent RNA helicase HrpA n=1 Tax=Spongiibacter taiwanensis TaxID=1748242 RepID=UPI0020350DA3|nr:ATP-dependent RNA helicase HrpA [Spongiibacter taiwanensis]USA43573.1 ATP-dependent RNA helicase HrpA [Spongiibacter taiwanensis]
MPEASLQPYFDALADCYLADQPGLRRRLRQLSERDLVTEVAGGRLADIRQRIDASIARRRERLEALPRVSYPPQLPVSERVADLREAIRDHQVVIIAGETGSGKTTQIPKICLELGRGVAGMIGHTQPRRLAARTVAQRLAEELNTPLGEGVGYQVRFQDVSGPLSHIKVMTDGVLLAAINHDRLLYQYDTLIIDEAHERSLNIDFLLGYLKTLLPRRPDLKLIITSATIDVDRFAAHFDQAPVVEVSGRSFPVEYRYRPMEESETGNDVPAAIESALEELVEEGASRRGDVLVFLSGEREIREVHRHLRHCTIPNLEVLPLYARLSNAEQQRIFDLGGRRGWRVVLATNVAETSLTVPGIHFVIDAGTARISRYSVRSKVQRLPIEPVSQASANQRAGRCGRLAPGIAYRLYSEEDFQRRPAFTDPEIQRTNLAAVILQMLQLGLGDIEKFPFIDPPDRRQVNDGYGLLQELAAVSGRRLNPLGKRLAQLPVDPRIGRLLLAAAEKGCLREMLIIASALSIQDPRERPADKQQAADEKHRRFRDEDSDFLAFLSLWDYAEEQRQALSSNQWRKLCQKEFLSWTRMREWREVHHQLMLLCRQLKLTLNKEPADYNRLHQALLPGFLSQIAFKTEERDYLGARNRKLRIFPGSALAKKKPKWIVAAELAETSQLFARCVARIEPDWVLGINDDLLKRRYYEPHYQAKTGRVVAFEQTLLFGLLLRDKQRVGYGPINPQESREIFIRQALVEGRYRGKADFFRHNKALIEEIAGLEDKTRRRDILASDEELFRFYDERLPDSVISDRHLHSWLNKQAGDKALQLSRGDAMRIADLDAAETQFPDSLHWAGHWLPLKYHFEPGHPADGVTVLLPLALLDKVAGARLDWLVPGLLREKCIALVKALPKAQRKQLVPVPDYVDRALARLQPSETPLMEALAVQLKGLASVDIDLQAWSEQQVDDYYRMNIRVLDDAGRALAESRDLAALRRKLSHRVQASIAQETGNGFASREVDSWDFGDLPAEHRFRQGGATLTAYPCLRAEGGKVELVLAESADQAARQSKVGVQRLLMLRLGQQVKMLRKNLFSDNTQQLQFAACQQDRRRWTEDALLAAVAEAFQVNQDSLPRTEAEFETVWERGRAEYIPTAERYGALLSDILSQFSDLSRRLKKLNNLALVQSVNDIRGQLARLFTVDFIIDLGLAELQQYPRYLKAIGQRLDKLEGNYQRDRQCTLTLAPLQEQLDSTLAKNPDALNIPALRDYRWMLEEFRVSLFAQQLGTAFPVSEKRLKQAWKALVPALS